MASIPEEVENRYRESDLGLLVPWAPQQAILAHEVTFTSQVYYHSSYLT